MNGEHSDSLLHRAQALIDGTRQQEYGDAEVNFTRIAELWSAFLGVNITPKDVPVMMALLKLAREKNSPKEDNLLDAAGYIGLAARL